MMKVQTTTDRFSGQQPRVRRRAVSSLLFILCVLSGLAVAAAVGNPHRMAASGAAQDSFSGEWLADVNRASPDEVQFTIMRRTARGGQQTNGNNIALGELQGLTREQTLGARTDVNFRLVREAGTFVCEGFFREGKGAGHWTLTPNQSFVTTMRGRGYDGLTSEDLFSAALFDINLKSIEDLKAAGYDRLSFKELIEASIFKVTGEFAREMKTAGFENLTFKQLVEARIFKVDAQYAKEVQAMGFGPQPLKTLVEMRIFKITPDFIREMRSAGFDNLPLRNLTELRIHKVTPEFVNELKAEGFASISLRQAVNLKIHGVDREFIKRVKAKGFNNVTLDQLINLRIHGIVN